MSDPTPGATNVAALHRMIDAMAAAIDPVVTAHAESENAHADKLAAQVALVTRILELAKPTVRALGTRPKIWLSVNDEGAEASQLASWRGLVLTFRVKAGARGEPAPMEITTARVLTDEPYPRGTYAGSHVFLREDGTLAQLDYEGSWHTQRGHENEWKAKERTISVETFCRDYTFAADPKNLAAQLVVFMDAAGDRKKPIAKARDLGAKFRAIVALL